MAIPPTMYHPKCGLTIRTGGNRNGHCSGCCRTFSGISAFDRHHTIHDGRVTCHDPETLVGEDGPVFEGTTEDGVTYWRLTQTPAQRAAHLAWIARLREETAEH